MINAVTQHQLQGRDKNQPQSVWKRWCWNRCRCFAEKYPHVSRQLPVSESAKRETSWDISHVFPSSDQLQLRSQSIFFLDHDEKWQIICRYVADEPPCNEKDLIVLTANTKLIRPGCFCGWPSVHRGHYHPINADWCCDLQTPIQLHPTGTRWHRTNQASAPQRPLSYFSHNRTGAVTHVQIFKKGQLEPLQFWIKTEKQAPICLVISCIKPDLEVSSHIIKHQTYQANDLRQGQFKTVWLAMTYKILKMNGCGRGLGGIRLWGPLMSLWGVFCRVPLARTMQSLASKTEKKINPYSVRWRVIKHRGWWDTHGAAILAAVGRGNGVNV